MAPARLEILFQKFISKTCTPAEKQELAEIILSNEQPELVNTILLQLWEQTGTEQDMDISKANDIFNDIIGASAKDQAKVISIRPRRFRWWAAASVLLLLAIGGYFIVNRKQAGKTDLAVNKPVQTIQAPQTNRATITTASGQTIYLDSAANGQLAMQGNISLTKLADGQIAYASTGSQLTTATQYNTLSNPRGSKVIDMMLADGSHVWLNAGSSLTFPVAFTGNERKVSITGEAYFEVAHNAAKPFFVTKGDLQVQVLGTHFNVNTYDDEEDIRVTLLQGSVNVTAATGALLLRPGQQAVINNAVPPKLNPDVDTEAVMAWKNGRFIFDQKTGIQTIMRQVARWYDVDVSYSQNIQAYFGGSISRRSDLSQVIKVLEATGNIKIKVNERSLIVMPAK